MNLLLCEFGLIRRRIENFLTVAIPFFDSIKNMNQSCSLYLFIVVIYLLITICNFVHGSYSSSLAGVVQYLNSSFYKRKSLSSLRCDMVQ